MVVQKGSRHLAVHTCISTQFSAVVYSPGYFFSWCITWSRTDALITGWKKRGRDLFTNSVPQSHDGFQRRKTIQHASKSVSLLHKMGGTYCFCPKILQKLWKRARNDWTNRNSVARLFWLEWTTSWFSLTSTLTTYLTPNTCLSTPRPKYQVPKINTHQLSSFAELCYYHCCPVKSLAAAKPCRVCYHTLTTDWLPAPLRTWHLVHEHDIMCCINQWNILTNKSHFCHVCMESVESIKQFATLHLWWIEMLEFLRAQVASQ